MTKWLAGLVLIFLGTAAQAASDKTDFGIRTVGAGPSGTATVQVGVAPRWTPLTGTVSLSAISSIGARWGRVTSTLRTPEHNRRVGGVPNSYHLRGRAIDIARRPGVSHSQIAAAYRAAGYHLVESLDEGDHSHFAFGRPGSGGPAVVTPNGPTEVTEWRVVSAPRGLR